MEAPLIPLDPHPRKHGARAAGKLKVPETQKHHQVWSGLLTRTTRIQLFLIDSLTKCPNLHINLCPLIRPPDSTLSTRTFTTNVSRLALSLPLTTFKLVLPPTIQTSVTEFTRTEPGPRMPSNLTSRRGSGACTPRRNRENGKMQTRTEFGDAGGSTSSTLWRWLCLLSFFGDLALAVGNQRGFAGKI